MGLTFDHVIIAVRDLDVAARDYRDLGFNVIYGGEHADGATHNALICFRDGTYIELIAPTGRDPLGDGPNFTHLLRKDEGFVGYALCANNLSKTAQEIRERGISVGDVLTGERRRKDGIQVRWKMAHTPDNCAVSLLIEDETPRSLRVPGDDRTITHPNGAQGIKTLMYLADDVEKARKQLIDFVGELPDDTALGATFDIGGVMINISQPATDVTRDYHAQRGNSIWRLVLRGVGNMYRRFDEKPLHHAPIVIVGDKRL